MKMNQINSMLVSEKDIKKLGRDSVKKKSIESRIYSFFFYMEFCLLNPKYFLVKLEITEKEKSEIELAELLYLFGCMTIIFYLTGIHLYHYLP